MPEGVIEAALRAPKLHVYSDDDGWRPATPAERKAAQKWSDMDALIALNGHVFVRNSIGQYDRWRGVGHKPGDEPK
jgi:hypothetical protein